MNIIYWFEQYMIWLMIVITKDSDKNSK